MRITMRTRVGEVVGESRGEGPPLLLLHANGLDRHAFDPVVPALARAHRVVAIDWPGMGDSPTPAEPRATTAALLADVLEDVVAALDGGPPVLVGNSVGGFAATRLAARHPERVRALVLVDPGGFAAIDLAARVFCALKGNEAVTRAVERPFAAYYLARRTPAVRDILARVAVAHRDPAKVAVNAAIWRSFREPASDLRAEAPLVRCPTLLVWGRRDPIIRAHVEGRTAAALVPRAQLVELDTGHCPFAEDPDAFLAAVEPFLATLPASALTAPRATA
jgi:pimeloyl-ACP methyl ester carboxylesterase